MLTEAFIVTGQCHLLPGSTLENLLAMSDPFYSLTAVTIHISGMSSASFQRDLIIINREKVQAMYLMGAPTTTQRLDDTPNPSTLPLTNP